MASSEQDVVTSPEEEQALHDLFLKLDMNRDGKIDMNDLTKALETMQLPQVPGHAKHFFEKYDKDSDGQINFEEFVKYVKEHEKELLSYFKNIDTNSDGYVDAGEIVETFKKLGVHIEKSEAERLLKRMDKDGTLKIDWNEWRNYLILTPSQSIHDILHYWRHSSCNLFMQVLEEREDLRSNNRRCRDEFAYSSYYYKLQMFLDMSLMEVSDTDQRHKHFYKNLGLISEEIIDIGENGLVPDDFTETELKTGMWWRHLVAGGAAGAVSRTCTAPLDRLKVLFQVHGSSKNTMTIRSGFKQMLDEGGVVSLWRGNGINVIKIAPESAIKFMAYEQIKAIFKGDSNKELGVIERLLSGSAAGAISQTIIYPMEVLKTRLALRKTGQYSGIFDCAKKVAKYEGLGSFYRGYIPNLLGIIPYAGIDLAIYETLKNLYIKKNKNKDPGILALLLCGTVSSTCGQLASYPLALVRTRLQAQAQTGSRSKDTMTGIFKHILKHDGPKGLYRGIAPNFLKVAPAVSISYVVYEQARTAMGIKSS